MELLFHPTSFVETGRPPSVCFDPIKSLSSLPGYTEKSLCQSADFSLWKSTNQSWRRFFPWLTQVQVRWVTYRMTPVWPSFDMITPLGRTSKRISDVKHRSALVYSHLSNIWMAWSYNDMIIGELKIVGNLVVHLCGGVLLGHSHGPLLVSGLLLRITHGA